MGKKIENFQIQEQFIPFVIHQQTMSRTSEELKEHIYSVSETLTQLHNTFETAASNSSVEDQLQSSKVLNPLDEIPKLSKLINAQVTKIGLVFKPVIAETTYKACWTELDSLVKYLVLLISLLNQLRKEINLYSSIFINELTQDTLSIIESSIALINELSRQIDIEEVENTDSSDYRLIGVGIVWESCDRLLKTFKNGSSGVLRLKLKQTNKLIVDALDELNEWLENPLVGGDFDEDDIFGLNKENDNEDDGESEAEEKADDEVIEYGKTWSTKIQLVKLLISLLDKSIPASKYTVKFSKSLDLFNEKRLKLNEFVDDLVACVVYDNDIEGAQNASKELTKEINLVVDLVRKINNDDEKRCKWLDSWKAKYQE